MPESNELNYEEMMARAENQMPDAQKRVIDKHITPTSIKSRKLKHERNTHDTELEDSQMPQGTNRPATFREKLRTFKAELFESKALRIQVTDMVQVDLKHFTEDNGKMLTDGTEIRPGDEIGVVDVQNIPLQATDQRDRDYTNALKAKFIEAMKVLAELCDPASNNHDKRMDKIKAFYGLSYLANRQVAQELGFDTEEITDQFQRLDATRTAYRTIMRIQHGPDSSEWDKALSERKKFRPPRHAYISKSKLMQLYRQR